MGIRIYDGSVGTKVTSIAILMIVLGLTLISCASSDALGASESEDTSASETGAVQQESIEVVAPTATATLVPTATTVPSPTVEVVNTDDAADRIKSESWSQPVKPFPESLKAESERLSGKDAVALWTEFIEGTRVEYFHGNLILEFCADGQGAWAYETGSPHLIGETFDYVVKADPGSSWNAVVTEISLHNKDLYTLDALRDYYVRLALLPPNLRNASSQTMSDRPVHVSPDCG